LARGFPFHAVVYRSSTELFRACVNWRAKKKAAAKGAAAGVKSSKMTDAKDFITERRYFDARFVGSVNNYCSRTATATKRL
jgi:hypothetical protein